MLRFLLLAALLPPVFAQTRPARKAPAPASKAAEAKAESWPLNQLTIAGAKLHGEEQIRQASGLKAGQPVNNAKFEAARERLIATGAFENVGFEFGPDASGHGVSGTITVTEAEIFPFRFEDLNVSESELRAFLKQREPLFETRIPATKAFVDRFTRHIAEFTGPRGLKDTVTGKIITEGKGELVVLFRPSTPAVRIAEVRFTGNEVLTAAQLGNAFGLVAVGTSFSEKNVRQLLDASIRPLYESRGRLLVEFPKIESKKMDTVDGVSVTVHVAEGPGFKFGKIDARGAPLTSKDLLSAANLKEDEPANFEAVRAAAEQIQKRFRAVGFMRSETTWERQVRDKDLKVDVAFKTVSGPRFQMGKLTIEGLDVTVEPVIRKLWSMTPGKPYNADYPQYFLDRVREDGYLEDLGATTFTQKINEDPPMVDVTLVFKGAPPKPKKGPKP